MNAIRRVRELNKRELEAGITPEGSWHVDYRDTAYIYIGGLHLDLSEGDIITIFSQFGEPVFINLVRDKETGKSRGFCFLKYEDQRSTDLAVDNLGGAEIMGRMLSVDHTRYKKRDGEDLGDNTGGDVVMKEADKESESEEEGLKRPLLKEEKELAELVRNHDDDDPMKAYLIEQKKEEVEAALKRLAKKEAKKDGKDRSRRHHHSRKHRSRSQSCDREKRRDKERERGHDRGKDHDRSSKRHRSRTPDKRDQRRRSPSYDDQSDLKQRRHREDSSPPRERRRSTSREDRRHR